MMIGIGLLKGLGVTMRNLLRGPVTIQYPDRRVGFLGMAKQKNTSPLGLIAREPKEAARAIAGLAVTEAHAPQSSRFRGQDFNWYAERCTGCASCAKFCPLGIIKIVTDPSGAQTQEGEVYDVEVFDIDLGRCMYCGICVEACPYDALHMGSGFERGNYERARLVIHVDDLKADRKTPSTWFRPQLEAQGYHPHRSGEASWRKVGRHEQPSREELTRKWVEER